MIIKWALISINIFRFNLFIPFPKKSLTNHYIYLDHHNYKMVFSDPQKSLEKGKNWFNVLLWTGLLDKEIAINFVHGSHWAHIYVLRTNLIFAFIDQINRPSWAEWGLLALFQDPLIISILWQAVTFSLHENSLEVVHKSLSTEDVADFVTTVKS